MSASIYKDLKGNQMSKPFTIIVNDQNLDTYFIGNRIGTPENTITEILWNFKTKLDESISSAKKWLEEQGYSSFQGEQTDWNIHIIIESSIIKITFKTTVIAIWAFDFYPTKEAMRFHIKTSLDAFEFGFQRSFMSALLSFSNMADVTAFQKLPIGKLLNRLDWDNYTIDIKLNNCRKQLDHSCANALVTLSGKSDGVAFLKCSIFAEVFNHYQHNIKHVEVLEPLLILTPDDKFKPIDQVYQSNLLDIAQFNSKLLDLFIYRADGTVNILGKTIYES